MKLQPTTSYTSLCASTQVLSSEITPCSTILLTRELKGRNFFFFSNSGKKSVQFEIRLSSLQLISVQIQELVL